MAKDIRPIKLLFQEIEKESQAAFNELFLAYYNKLVAFAMPYVRQRECAEELTSELFMKLWLKRNTLSHILNPEVYLYVSVKNAALNQLRGNKKQHIISAEEGDSLLHLTDNLGSDLERKELMLILDDAVKALPGQRKIIFKLIKEDGLKCKEVAQILGISVRTVESQMYKAVKALADTLSLYLGYHPQKRRNRKQLMALLSSSVFF